MGLRTQEENLDCARAGGQELDLNGTEAYRTHAGRSRIWVKAGICKSWDENMSLQAF